MNPYGGMGGRPPEPPLWSTMKFMSTVMSLFITYFAGEWLYDVTEDLVKQLLMETHGETETGLWLHYGFCYVAVFATVRVVIITQAMKKFMF